MAEEIVEQQFVQEDPQPKPSIYKFLKENNLTTKDEATFNKDYSNAEKQKELYNFMKENQLTTKDFNTFSSDNFGALKKYGYTKRSFTSRLIEWFGNIYRAITVFPSAY